MVTTSNSPAQTKSLGEKLRPVIEIVVVAVCTWVFATTCVGVLVSMLKHNAAGSRDFVEYWAAGRQLVQHANPYDSDAILRLERSAGFPLDIAAQIMANPPWILPLVFPLGFLGPMTAEILWLLLSLAGLIASVRLVWIMHGRPRTQLNFLGYTFGPAVACILSGQINILLLLGLVLFLQFHQSRPFLAGVALSFCLLKPQLFLPFGIALLAWAIRNKSYRLLLGAAAALAAGTAIALAVDHQVWAHYRQMMSAERIDRLNIPCLSITLRLHVWPHTLWLQCLPAAIACIWAFSYFRKHRDSWDWIAHGSPLMLVSILVAPYIWFMDQAVLIPALLHAAYLTRSRSLIAILALASAAIEIQLCFAGLPPHSAAYLWTAPAWLAWYLCAARFGPNTRELHAD